MFSPQNSQRQVPGCGNLESKICLIGDVPGLDDQRIGMPFSGTAGSVLDGCLQAAGLTRSDCYITNVLKYGVKGNDPKDYYNIKTGAFSKLGMECVTELMHELSTCSANVLVPLGPMAMSAVIQTKSVSKYRGYVMETKAGRKCIPTYHPSSSLRGQYILRYYMTADFKKAKVESAYPEIIRPPINIIIPTTISECRQWIGYLLNNTSSWSCDIEVVNFEVSAIGFSALPELSISFPFYHEHWTEDEECELWRMMATLLESEHHIKIFQNGIFDIQFLMTQCGIHAQSTYDDTMIAHHIMYPDMLKGLGFLGSLYCGSREYWKDAVKFENIKEDN